MKLWSSARHALLFLAMLLAFQASFSRNILNLQSAASSFDRFEAGGVETVLRSMDRAVQAGGVGWGDYLLQHSGEDDVGETLKPYFSSFGLQGLFFSAVALRQGGDVARSADRGAFWVALATAALMSLFGLFVRREFGGPALVAYVLGSMLSVWFVFAARNIYLMFFLKLLPFGLTMMLFPLCMNGSRWRFAALAVLVGVSTLTASLCLFDYISNTVLSVAVAPVYFGISRGQSSRQILGWMRGLLFAAAAAVVLAILLTTFKAGLHKGSLAEGAREIAIAVTSRSFGAADTQRATELSLGDVWLGYWPLPLMAWPHQTPDNYRTYFSVFALLAAWVLLTAVAFLDGRRFPAFEARRAQLVALAAATGWALLAAVSWGVVMKGHMAHHYHVNGMMFSIPYLPMLFVFVGSVLSVAGRQLLASARTALVSLSEHTAEGGHDHE